MIKQSSGSMKRVSAGILSALSLRHSLIVIEIYTKNDKNIGYCVHFHLIGKLKRRIIFKKNKS